MTPEMYRDMDRGIDLTRMECKERRAGKGDCICKGYRFNQNGM